MNFVIFLGSWIEKIPGFTQGVLNVVAIQAHPNFVKKSLQTPGLWPGHLTRTIKLSSTVLGKQKSCRKGIYLHENGKCDFRWCWLGSDYLSGHPQSVTHLHLTADPTAWTGHPFHLHLALLHIHHTVVPAQHTQQYTEMTPPPTHEKLLFFVTA